MLQYAQIVPELQIYDLLEPPRYYKLIQFCHHCTIECVSAAIRFVHCAQRFIIFPVT